MHKGILISVYDAKAETWTPPQCSASKAAAIRELEQVVNSPEKKSMLATSPEDFALFQLGSFEDGKITALPAAECICKAVEVRRNAEA